MSPSRRVIVLLAVLAVLELATLGVLLVNLATAHLRPITQSMGPVHGAVYTVIVVIMIFAPGFRIADRLLGCIPVVGGAIALIRALRRPAQAE
jgi:hypothetical protein